MSSFDIGSLDPRLLLACVLLVAIALVALGIKIAQAWAAFKSRWRNSTAQEGEEAAEEILIDAGYSIVARQHAATWTMIIDGKKVPVGVRVDLIVERNGQQYVAEVKTGDRAPNPALPATRRQLLEYSFVFGAPYVLLVDVPARQIHTVSFARPKRD